MATLKEAFPGVYGVVQRMLPLTISSNALDFEAQAYSDQFPAPSHLQLDRNSCVPNISVGLEYEGQRCSNSIRLNCKICFPPPNFRLHTPPSGTRGDVIPP